MAELSTKPYLIRAIYEWCADSSLTPYLAVRIDANTRVPMEYVKNGEIVLSISQQATRNLTFGNDIIQFSARFNGVSREISVPISAVQGIFARENGQGMFFDPEQFPNSSDAAPAASPTLHTVPNGPHIVAFEPDEGGGEDEQGPPDKPKAPPRGKLRVIK